MEPKRLNLLTVAQVERKVAMHRTTIYKLMEKGEFPKGVKMSIRRRVWEESTIDEWIADFLRAREEESAA